MQGVHAVDDASRNAIGLYNLGTIQRKTGEIEQSVTAYRQALAIAPDFPKASFNLSLSLLTLGRWDEGFALYEYRHAAHGTGFPTITGRRWRGEDLAGKHLLVVREDGLGDEIMAFRYARLLAERAGRVTWYCDARLRALLEAQGEENVGFRAKQELPGLDYDYWTPTGSLPLMLHTGPGEIPGAAGYLRATPRKTGRVGLVWRGNPAHKNDAHRSLSLDDANRLRAALGEEGEVISLHPEDTGATSFAETAQIVAGLERVVTVDTSVAHLAGAMGKPTSVLLPSHETDWRWLRSRSDSPWYRSVRLFRQAKAGDWTSVFEEVAQAARGG